MVSEIPTFPDNEGNTNNPKVLWLQSSSSLTETSTKTIDQLVSTNVFMNHKQTSVCYTKWMKGTHSLVWSFEMHLCICMVT